MTTTQQKRIINRHEPARPATRMPCPNCRRPVIRGRVDSTTEWSLACEPEPVTMLGEAQALLAGFTTYRLVYSASGGRRLDGPRNQFDIPAVGAGMPGIDILVEHRCGVVAHYDTRQEPLSWDRSIQNPEQFDRSGY